MKTPLTISAITIVFSINAQVKKLNDLSDVLVEDSSLYVGHTPIYTNDAISNVAIGQGTLSLNTKGDFNTAIGQDALFSNIEGYSNTASGYRALFSNIEGYFNTASGDSSLLKNTTGVYNTATGSMALMFNTSGAYNTATGCQALYNNLTGFNNTASGYMALMYNTTGAFNTASGNQALYNNTTGNYNTAFGYKAMASAVDATNQTVIGYEATGQADNSVVLGNENVTAVYMGEDSGAKIYAGEGSFTGNITIGGDVVVSSDARLKANIMSLGSTLAKLLLIDGKTYTTRRDGKQKIGVLAQDIQNVFPELVSQDDDKMLAVNYQGLIPILINALKEQDAKISRLEQLTKELITNE